MACPFCEIIAGRAPGVMPTRWEDAVVIEPLNPVTDGHVLIVPRRHVRDFAENRSTSASVMARVAEYLRVGPYPGVDPVGPCNVITSCGAEATQTVMHLHVHVVPRRAGDGLSLPWSTCGAHMADEDAVCDLPRDHAGWHEEHDRVGAVRAAFPPLHTPTR